MSQRIPSVADIIGMWPSAEAFSEDIGLKYRSHGRVMKMRGRIPRAHWPKIIESARRREIPLSEQTLADAHEREQRAG